MWTPGRLTAAFATANGDPNKIKSCKPFQIWKTQTIMISVKHIQFPVYATKLILKILKIGYIWLNIPGIVGRIDGCSSMHD